MKPYNLRLLLMLCGFLANAYASRYPILTLDTKPVILDGIPAIFRYFRGPRFGFGSLGRGGFVAGIGGFTDGLRGVSRGSAMPGSPFK